MDPGDGDISQLLPPVATSVSGLNKILSVFRTGTPEVQQLLGTECNVILECKKCRSLFRSIANFISHKRAYCNKPYNAETHDTGYQEVYSTIESINHELAKRDLDQIVGRLQLRASQTGSDGVRGENPEATQRSQYFTAVAEAVKERRAARTDICITLAPLPGTSRAVTQNVAKQPEQSSMSSLQHEMKKCTVELTPLSPPSLKVLQAQNKSLPLSFTEVSKRPRGRPRKMSFDQVRDSSPVSGSSSNKPKGLPSTACTNYCCEKCHAQFTTQKSLSLHESTQHMTTRLQYRCPCCKNSFCNLWSTYRHLKLVHEKSQEQVDKLKSVIRQRAIRISVPLFKLDSIPRAGSTPSSASKTIMSPAPSNTISQNDKAWLGNDNNFTVDVGDHRCGICGLRFERKAALVSHTNTCHKKPPNPGPKPAKSPRSSSPTSSRSSSVERGGRPAGKPGRKSAPTKLVRNFIGVSSTNSPEKSQPAQISPAKSDSTQISLAKSDSTQASPAKSNSTQVSPVKSNSTQVSPAKQESPKVPTPTTSPLKTPVKTPSKELATPVKSPEIPAKQSPVKEGTKQSPAKESSKTSGEKPMSNGPLSPKVRPMKSRPNIINRRRILPKPPVLTSAVTVPNPPATVPTLTREVPDQSEKMPPPLSSRPPLLSPEKPGSVEKCTQLSLKPKPVESPAPAKPPEPTKCNGPSDAHRFIKISSGEVITLTATNVRPEDKSKVITITPMLKSNMLGQAAVIAGDAEGVPKVIKLHRITPNENGEKVLCVKQLINMQGLNGKGVERGLEDTLSQQRAEILVRTVNTEKTPSMTASPKESATSEVMLVKHAASTSLPGNWFAAGSADRKWSGPEPGSRSNIQVRRDYAKCAYSSESSCSPRPGSSQQDFTLPTNEEESSSSSDEVDGEVNGDTEVNGVDSADEGESEGEQEGSEVNGGVSEEDSEEGSEVEDSQTDEEMFQGWDPDDSSDDLQKRVGFPQLTDMSLVYDLIDSEDSSSASSGEETSEIDSLEVASRDFDSDSPHNSQGPESDSTLQELESPDSAVQELDQDSHENLPTQQSEPEEDSSPPSTARIVRSTERNVRKTRAKVSDFNVKRMKLNL